MASDSSDGMAGCFDPIRPRTHSFDLHLLMQHSKIMKFSKLFRSRSDTNVKGSPRSSPCASPRTSPRSSPGAPARRRFMRVVRDDQSSGEEYENPHVIRKYSQKYCETLSLRKSQSMDEPRTRPYTLSGDTHTILKKYSSFEAESATATPDHSPPSSKHASFREEVEVIEYDKKDKIQKHRFSSHRERISFDEVEDELGMCSLDDELPIAACPLVEVNEKDEYDACDEEDQGNTSQEEDVFPFDADEEEHGAKSEERLSPVEPKEPVVDSPGLSRQLSSDSDTSDNDCRSKKKKSKFEDLRDTEKSAESKETAMGRDAPRKIEIES